MGSMRRLQEILFVVLGGSAVFILNMVSGKPSQQSGFIAVAHADTTLVNGAPEGAAAEGGGGSGGAGGESGGGCGAEGCSGGAL